jgi:CelD/BcsL family acetyltransferase involved in cellulose biosynthesis
VSAVRQVGGEKQTKQVSETAKRAAMRPEGGYVDLNLTREGSRRMVLRRDKVEIGNSGEYAARLGQDTSNESLLGPVLQPLFLAPDPTSTADSKVSQMKVRRLSWSEAQTLAGEWNLFAPTVFTTFDWQASWYEAYGGPEPIVIACADGSSLLGLAVLQRQGRRLRFLGDGTYDSVNLDFIYKANSVIPELVRAAKGLLGPLGVLDLRTIPSSSPSCSALADGWLSYRYETPHLVIPLQSSWDAYLKTLSSKMRSSLTRKVKKADRRCRVIVCQTEEQLPAFLNKLYTLHGERWHSRGEEGAFSLRRRNIFFELVAKRFLRQGWLRFWMLELEGKEAAIEFGFTFRGVHSVLQCGFDPQLAADSPGIVLRAILLKTLIQEGVRYYDFLGGNEAYKYKWGASDMRFVNITATRLVSLGSLWLMAKKLYRKVVPP